MEFSFPSPLSVEYLQDYKYSELNFHFLPFMYAMINMHTITIDVTNSAGLGHNALISIGEEDRS